MDISKYEILYVGKVRNVYKINEHKLLLNATDKISGFNKHICNIKNKGKLLNLMSIFWFEKTNHIINNHLISYDKELSPQNIVVHNCRPFKIEVVVRGYITGNTETSLWTHYNNGIRNYCGITFPDGLVKNQKLEYPIVTPTTKDHADKPISPKEIIDKGYMTKEQMDYIFKKALELYNFGATYSETKGLILVDTKYEFGLDNHNNIILIDELHTCDSSRYWLKDTYESKFKQKVNPDKLDKDQIRDWVKSKCDPYNEVIPMPPNEIINKVYNTYNDFYKMLTKDDI